MKFKKSALAIFGPITAMALTSCGAKAEVTFWTSFGENYGKFLNPIVQKIAKELNVSIKETDAGSIKNIYTNMVGTLGTSKYPSIAMGYPDHFAHYHGSGILKPLEKLFEKELKDYDSSYIPENYFVDGNGSRHLYGVPFNKSTELLGYNGVFVDYVAEKNHDASLKQIPTTWAEWAAAKDEPSSKAGKYLAAFQDLITNKRKVWAIQDADGSAHDFTTESAQSSGKTLVLDYSGLTAETQAYTSLMGWDATDNAFITLLRQFGSEYTKLGEEQLQEHPKQRAGTILFANKTNLSKTVNMLKYFNKMHSDKIFGLGGLDLHTKNGFCTDAYAAGRVMFMVCSSGGLSYNTDNWEKRFRLAPIPYTDANHKYVISQGMNICMTKNADPDKAVKVMKALTTGKYQTEWSLKSGYFPASKSAEDSKEYQDFIKSNSYKDKKVAIYREGHKVNYNHYRVSWKRFVDDAFPDSSLVRDVIANVLEKTFKITENADQDAPYISMLQEVLNDQKFKTSDHIIIDVKDTGIIINK